MIEVTTHGILLGLSTGIFCLGYCGPVFVPLMMSGDGRVAGSVRVIGELALGRLLAYLILGASVGYLSVRLEGPLLQFMGGASMVALSLFLLLYVLTKGWPRFRLCRQLGKRYFRFPAAFGFLTGFNVCPPLLLAISYAVGIGSVGGIFLFIGFFAGTSVYLILLLPLGYLARWENLRLIALMTALLSGAFFLLMGVARLIAL